MDFSKLSREDWMVGGGGILLVLDLLILPWYSVSVFGHSFTSTGTGAPDGFFAVLALLLVLVVVVDLALERFSPQTQLPTTPLGRTMTRVAALGVAALCLIIKFLDHTSNFGFGFFLAVILMIVTLVGAWMSSQGTSTAV
jgi:hypothetical protein